MHEQFLLQQIEEKRRRKFMKMNDQEYLYNKRLIDSINMPDDLDD